MRRYVHLILVALFLSAQLLAYWHMAEHGFEEHEHDGHPCEIQLFCDHIKLIGLDDGAVISTPQFFAITADIPARQLFTFRAENVASPRAPPAIS